MKLLVQKKVNIEAFGTFEAITEDGSSWNGFECPYFTKEVADKLMDSINNSETDLEMRYDELNDKYIYLEDGYEPEIFEAVELNGEKYYPIGAFGWVWTQCED